MNKFAKLLFKNRSYTPLPFVLLMFIFYRGNLSSWLIGALILITGELIRIWGVAYAGSITRTTTSVKASSLITSGPFAYVRNPLYIGNILIYFGFGIISLAVFPYVQLIALLWFIFQYYLIIKIEEDFLENKFGQTYIKYKNRVPRILPKFTFEKRVNNLEISPNYRKAFHSESSTFKAIIAIPILLFIIHMVKY